MAAPGVATSGGSPARGGLKGGAYDEDEAPPSWRARIRRWLTPPRKLRVTREGRYYIGITLAVGAAAINTANNLLYLLLGMLLSLIVFAWGIPPVKTYLNGGPNKTATSPANKNFLDGIFG